ncbi:hypothetical protein GGTG_04922 [Gaeumannomyces tritici R3-111a-1]|uniref:Uncharacterized protein n=1 Tax=Gaeumannomyces tritici (strain R3-111a-1) TaxID=644352 RepID=J3NUG6_GAET3|nr:hypothetical protein GGTG_04922 [Gaeumannomyces tritici R3-111a-1]EJT79839.1 hypothetical protein GGTG_04922 [Gaeumannomyces tritici R3-111a-1]
MAGGGGGHVPSKKVAQGPPSSCALNSHGPGPLVVAWATEGKGRNTKRQTGKWQAPRSYHVPGEVHPHTSMSMLPQSNVTILAGPPDRRIACCGCGFPASGGVQAERRGTSLGFGFCDAGMRTRGCPRGKKKAGRRALPWDKDFTLFYFISASTKLHGRAMQGRPCPQTLMRRGIYGISTSTAESYSAPCRPPTIYRQWRGAKMQPALPRQQHPPRLSLNANGRPLAAAGPVSGSSHKHVDAAKGPSWRASNSSVRRAGRPRPTNRPVCSRLTCSLSPGARMRVRLHKEQGRTATRSWRQIVSPSGLFVL